MNFGQTMTTIYLIRHAVRMEESLIVSRHSSQEGTILREKSILSVEGEWRAEVLSRQEELKNIDTVYASNCVRTLQTAKYLMEKQNLPVHIDDRLDERRIGKPTPEPLPDWFARQYRDMNIKTEGGESLNEVQARFSEAIEEIAAQHMFERVAVFSHGYAITSYLLRYCELLDVSGESLRLGYRGKLLLDRPLNAPEVFRLTFAGQEPQDIALVEFRDLPYVPERKPVLF